MVGEARPEAEELILLLARQTKDHAIVIVDTEGRIVSFSPGASQIFDRSADEAVGQPLSVLFTPEDIARGIPQHELAVAAADGASEDDRWMARRDGSRFWASGVLLALRAPDGRILGYGKLLRNRTDFRVQLEALRNSNAALEARIANKGTFIAVLAHEVRNPLAAITQAVEVLRRKGGASAEFEAPLALFDRQLARIQRMIDDLLQMSRVEAGKADLSRRAVALREIVDRAVESASAPVREGKHRLQVLFPATPIIVDADPDRLEQVFVNLLVNAAKYTPSGGRIWVKATTDGSEAVVQVEDTGIGISPELLPRIFDLFTQADGARSMAQEGLGIGLAVVKELVTLHEGTVQVRSNGPGKGSEFAVRLPLKAPGP
jgi:two-component system CheB/CheR fusion protein